MKKKQKARKHPTASKATPSSKANTKVQTVSTSKWIRIDRPFPLPAFVKQAIQILDDAGFIAYVVGGSVRDFLMGKDIRETKDHDIATSAGPNQLCELFPDAITVGKAFGVIKVPVQDSGSPKLLEIATFREDLEYQDFRHPRKIRFAGPYEDAVRRDFTINGLYYDPKTSRILDSVGGIEDIKLRTVRAIGEPVQRFKEDALRLMRAVRFTTSLGFMLEAETFEAIRINSKLIAKISHERIRDELSLMLTGPNPAGAVSLLSKLGILGYLLPEVECLKEGDMWDHTLKILEKLPEFTPKRSVTLGWAALLQEVGKPMAYKRSGGKNVNGHELDGGRIAAKIGERFRLSRLEIAGVVKLIEDHLKFRDVFKMREATLERFIREPHFEELLALHRADAIATDGNLAFYEFCSSRVDAMKKTSGSDGGIRLIDGTDLIQLGLHPGPDFSEILRTVEDLALEHKLNSKEDALEYVVKHFVK